MSYVIAFQRIFVHTKATKPIAREEPKEDELAVSNRSLYKDRNTPSKRIRFPSWIRIKVSKISGRKRLPCQTRSWKWQNSRVAYESRYSSL